MTTPDASIFAKYTSPETFARIRELPSVSAMWSRCLEEYSTVTALCDGAHSYTYAETEARTARFRTVITQSHAGSSRIALLAPNSFAFVMGFLAVTTLGYTAVVLPPQLDAEAVFGLCMKFGIGTLLYHDALADKTAVVSQKAPGIACVRLSEDAETATPLCEVGAEVPCAVMFTGGTTGKSKGALLSNGAVLQGTVNGCYGYREVFGQRYLLVLPLSHVFGLIRNLLTSLYTGSTLYICRNNTDMFRDIARFRPTIWVVVPALAEMALNLSQKFGRNMLGPDMKYIICGAAAVAPYLIEAYRALGITVFPGYGLTESANLVSGNPECFARPDSVGILYPHQEVRIVDGELWLRGKNMMDGYLGEADGADSEGWFHTGDLARLDSAGFLYITGRVKEIIVLANGENISPAEVEAAFNRLRFVRDAQVFEDVTESGRHILALEIVPRMTELADIAPADRQHYMLEALEAVNRELPGPQRVNRITVRDSDFERTPSMKIVRYKKCN